MSNLSALNVDLARPINPLARPNVHNSTPALAHREARLKNKTTAFHIPKGNKEGDKVNMMD